MRPFAVLPAIALLTAATADAQITLRPGQYEYTLQMNLPVPKEATKAVLDAAGFDKEQKRLDCITADDAKQAKEDVVQFFAREMEQQSCKMSDVKVTASTLSFTSTCVEDSVKMVIRNEMTFAADSFSGVATMTGDGGLSSTSRMSAQRIGECK